MYSSSLTFLTPNWCAPSNVNAYCTNALGGYSEGNYTSLNLALHVGDNTENVHRNRALLPCNENIQWLDQVHGTDVAILNALALPTSTVSENIRSSSPITADASYTNNTTIACCVMTADCLPILLCDVLGEEVSAVHAGWKGLKANIIENALAQFSAPVDHILAWIGPAICQACFETSSEVAKQFEHYPSCLITNNLTAKTHIDLAKIAAIKLRNAGVRSVSTSNICTYCNTDYFSYRRSTHHQQNNCGRMASVISLNNT